MNNPALTISGNNKTLVLNRPHIMAVLNVTPDSFSDGGRFNGRDAALRQAERLLDQGADIIDVGGESTRPNASPVTVEEELRRTIDVIDAIQQEFDTFVSIDTSKPEVMRQAAQAGVNLINDVRALRVEGALEAAAKTQLPVCLMHMQGEPSDMQENPVYEHVADEVNVFLKARVDACEAAGISCERIVLDPGFGFGKSVAHNYQLLSGLPMLAETGLPLLVGLSRKSMIGAVTGAGIENRLVGSVTLATIAAMQGAHIFRVHDVAQTKEALALVHYYHEVNA